MALAHWTFHGCTDDERLQIQAFWENRCPGLERLLVCFPEQLDGIELTVRRATSPDRFQAAAVLPWTKPIAAEATATSWTEALDKIADNLVCQMKCYLEGRRREWVERRRAAVRRELNGAKPLLANRRGLAQREQFFALLRPLLAHLQPYIERELRLLKFQRRFPHQHWTSEEILDELLVRSWERIDTQGSDPTPDVWLMMILQEILGEMALYPFRVAFESLLSHPIAAPEADAYDRFFLDHDLAVFADALSPDRKTPGWDVLHRKKQQRRLERALAGLPMQQRQAFVQHFLEGFTPAEIATIQSRDASEIVADVEAGKAAMKREVDEITQTSHCLASLTQA